ncbi:MAG: NADPH dehydrogenase [Verrucomicrobiae bacterium]|nr:NADPH dehydrogenase [Verrucomicrobiae bacterium]
MSFVQITRIPSLKTPQAFRDYCGKIGADLQIEDSIVTGNGSPLMKPLNWNGRTIGNSFCIHPMEGWDGTETGGATEPMIRRWQRFGESGAKIIFGGEAMAVRPDGRANPNQLLCLEQNKKDLALLRETALKAHPGKTDDLVIGFQLTHSGRFCKPNDKKRFESRVAYRHPILDKKFSITSDAQVFTDDELKRLIEDYGRAAKIAFDVGADFVDIKHCHGYLLHELLGAHTRPGLFGGSLENRTRMLREIVALIRSTVPKLGLAVRVSIFDLVPFKPDPALSKPGALGPGIPEDYSQCLPYRYGFGVNQQNPTQYDLTEPVEFLKICESLGITLINISGGSPYYNPHVSRPAAYPPSDGYQPPEEPLIGVARHINVVKQLKAKFPKLILIGTAYTYLQEYLPHVAQHYLRHGHVDSVGLGRVVLSYPRLLADAVEKGDTERRLICRTFSDCTTAPRNGLRSGCYPLDEYYKKQPEAAQVKQIKLTMGAK